MTLASPGWLWLLLAVAALAFGYVAVLRRGRARAVRFANLATLERLGASPRRWRRHAPIALLLVALAVLVIALAGPEVDAAVPRDRASVLVVLDVSLSMRAGDLAPSRLAVAEREAAHFADQLSPGIDLGLMTFAGTTRVVVSPTTNHEAFKAALPGAQLAESTATGDAVLGAIALLRSSGTGTTGSDAVPARIVLLSDGKQTEPTSDPALPPRGAFPAADEARAAHIPITAVSLGTAYGTIDIDGRTIAVPAADADMQTIAAHAGGDFFRATSDPDLRSAYDNLVGQVGYETRLVDTGHAWLLAGTLLVCSALVVAFATGQRLP